MMQNSPLFVAPPSATKNATQSPVAKPTNDAAKEGESFKNVLSKQVKHEETKGKSESTKDTDVAKGESEDAQTVSSVETEVMEDGGAVDPQLLASTATAKAVEDVTDGEVVLDAQQAEDATEVLVGNITPNVQIKQTVKSSAVGSDVSVDKTKLASKLSSNDVDAEAVNGKEDLASDHEKKVDPVIENDKGINSKWPIVVGEKKARAVEELPTSQSISSINNVSSLSAMSMQAAAKAFSQPTVAAEQVGASSVINVAPGKTGWSEAIGQKVVWMVGAAEQSATLTLNPKDLGPLQVIINVNNEKADATFISENPEVRKALEEGMSNLRQSMGQAGVELGQANVNTNKEHQAFQQANKGQVEKQPGGDDGMQDAESLPSMPIHTQVSNGLVDTFV